MDLSYMSVISL
jgi:hypothetical protein